MVEAQPVLLRPLPPVSPRAFRAVVTVCSEKLLKNYLPLVKVEVGITG